MSDTFRPTPADNYAGGTSYGSTPNQTSYEPPDATPDVGRTLMIGLLGGIVSAAGYLVYQRLPNEQKEKLHGQVRGALQQRISELRNNFNF
ncbi:MAG: hypothetical protein DLM50_05725 [Candidatus Meridianibacter frigidus]|nr:MAG: hypothetical protein DLM50_05725 [Candidatus Eremiobacteraeota bacterium]